MDLYSVVCVRDRATSQKWFAVFFGRPADEVIGEEYLWQVGENAWVVIDDRYMRAARVGGAMITPVEVIVLAAPGPAPQVPAHAVGKLVDLLLSSRQPGLGRHVAFMPLPFWRRTG